MQLTKYVSNCVLSRKPMQLSNVDSFFVKKFFENAYVSPFGFFRAVGKTAVYTDFATEFLSHDLPIDPSEIELSGQKVISAKSPISSHSDA